MHSAAQRSSSTSKNFWAVATISPAISCFNTLRAFAMNATRPARKPQIALVNWRAYSEAASRRLRDAIVRIGQAMAEEGDVELQTLLSAAFVRLKPGIQRRAVTIARYNRRSIQSPNSKLRNTSLVVILFFVDHDTKFRHHEKLNWARLPASPSYPAALLLPFRPPLRQSSEDHRRAALPDCLCRVSSYPGSSARPRLRNAGPSHFPTA